MSACRRAAFPSVAGFQGPNNSKQALLRVFLSGYLGFWVSKPRDRALALQRFGGEIGGLPKLRVVVCGPLGLAGGQTDVVEIPAEVGDDAEREPFGALIAQKGCSRPRVTLRERLALVLKTCAFEQRSSESTQNRERRGPEYVRRIT